MEESEYLCSEPGLCFHLCISVLHLKIEVEAAVLHTQKNKDRVTRDSVCDRVE